MFGQQDIIDETKDDISVLRKKYNHEKAIVDRVWAVLKLKDVKIKLFEITEGVENLVKENTLLKEELRLCEGRNMELLGLKNQEFARAEKAEKDNSLLKSLTASFS